MSGSPAWGVGRLLRSHTQCEKLQVGLLPLAYFGVCFLVGLLPKYITVFDTHGGQFTEVGMLSENRGCARHSRHDAHDAPFYMYSFMAI